MVFARLCLAVESRRTQLVVLEWMGERLLTP